MNDKPPFSAVIFDLDGTLLDTLDDIAHAANDVLLQQGFPAHPLDAYRYFVGEGVRILFRRALPETSRSDEVVEACALAFRDAYSRLWNVHTRPYAGVADLLAALRTRQLKQAVLSNKPDLFTRRCVAEYFPKDAFQVVLGQREGVPQKPDPVGASEIADRLYIPADRFLFLGDTAVDMQTARAAGMYPVGALWGFRPLEELQEGGAEVVIHEPAQLLDVLGYR
jgi:phosphoglycolate phosphatase